MADVYLPMMKSAALVSAGQLGLFEALAEGPRTVPELARSLNASEQGVHHLVDFLAAIGYLLLTDAGVANAPHTARWFTAKGRVDYTAGLLWTAESWTLMGQLSDAVRRGAPSKTLWESMRERPHWGPVFSRYMRSFAEHLGPELVAQVPLPAGARRLLDLGGSHGLHSIRFCRQYPALTSVIFDLPTALTQTAGTVAEAGLSDRIDVRPGDVLDGDFGDGYDVVFYLSVAHNQTAEDNRRIVARIGRALRPGGLLLIHEYLTGEPLDQYDAAFRLTLLVETATRTYGYDEIAGWLADGGFDAPRRIDLNPREKGSLVVATRR
jgi:SAM-dependent methyltransferase